MAIYSGSYMDDLLRGMSDDDILWGGLGDDTLEGGGGNDRLIGGPGADKLNGGPGMDIADYISSPSGVQVDLATDFTDDADERPAVREGDAEGDSLTSIESLWGSMFGDIFKGNHSPNYLFGNAGDDIISGRGGNDLLRGGADNDLLGGDGDAEEGNDTLYGDEGADGLKGGLGNDRLFGGVGDDVLEGGAGHDFLEGGPGADALDGGPGSDTAAYTMSAEAVTVDLRFGEGPANPGATPPIVAPTGGDAMGDTFVNIENLRGSMHDDLLIGDNGVPMEDNPATDVKESDFNTGNRLFGNMGNDMLKGLGGNDVLRGGKGMDTVYGGDGNDTLMGEMGDDDLKGDDGDDTLIGGPGADKLFGGKFIAADMRPGADNSEKDTADYSNPKATEGVTVSLIPNDHDNNAATPVNIMGKGGDAEGDVLVGIEYLTGSPHKDMLEGNEKPNLLKGGGGDDWNEEAIRGKDGGLYGGMGNDTLEGGAGNDWLKGEGDNDTLKGGSGNDMLDGGVQTDAPTESATTPVITGRSAAVNVAATDVNESAMRAHDTFDQVLEGGAGDDTLMGGMDVQKLDGGTGVDTVDYTGVDRNGDTAGGGVTIVLDDRGNFGTKGVDLSTPPDGDFDDTEDVSIVDGTVADDGTVSDNTVPQIDVLVGIENLIGSDAADRLIGNRGRNVLEGGEGNDSLTGGGGSDIFVFGENTEDGTDTITDFSKRGGDQIDLSELGLTATDLATVLGADPDGTSELTYTLDLSDHGGGDIIVVMDERFAELDAGDFII